MQSVEQTVLVVEDCAELRELARLSLNLSGWRVVEADCVQGALRFASNPLDVILADQRLPDGLGTDLIEKMTAPVVLFSADLPNSLPTGVLGVIPKPFNPAKLGDRLRSILDT